ncbi:unnamed protein product [Pieris macdunnoughi]|uniref:Tesmin/TSO1-like CXC domain-containing protein n=1 Tax=Pieris macdunnoughi TaxID=345717 RepID=A0A821UGK1_9NEOP|nr:unnamed protein product [Pieris macdunnoughi]
MSSTVKVHEEKVPVDPVLLFQRMSVTAAFQDEIEKYFEYELAPYPLTLFDDIGMRKTQKSAIYDCFQTINVDINNTNSTYIIDGGFLLHRVVWDSEETFNVILDKYVQYVRRHFGSRVTVVFDGYDDYTRNIKAAEQRRRNAASSTSSDIIFDDSMTVPTSQQKFFANNHNKSRFISMLKAKFTAENISVEQANDDADVLIIETAIKKFSVTNTTVVVAPEKLLNTIFCNCKKGCSAKCGCRKVGLFCSLACTHCQGRSCSNVESPTLEDSFDTDQESLLGQFTCEIEQEEEEEQEDEQEEEGEEDQEEEETEILDSYESDD